MSLRLDGPLHRRSVTEPALLVDGSFQVDDAAGENGSRLVDALRARRWTDDLAVLLTQRGWGVEEMNQLQALEEDPFFWVLCDLALVKEDPEVLQALPKESVLEHQRTLKTQRNDRMALSAVVPLDGQELLMCPPDLEFDDFLSSEERERNRNEYFQGLRPVVSDELAQWLRTQFRWDEQDIQFLQDASSRADMMVGKLITLALEKEDWEILQSLPTEYARDVHDQIDAEIEELDRKLAFLDDHVAIGDEEQEIFSL